jgi:hypothetical protein
LTILLLFLFRCLPAQTPAELRSWLPAVQGWAIGEAEVFGPDNLFDRINGAAPLFLENNFREMTAVDYKKGDDYITIQAYRHATPEDAFGMYASERSTELAYIPGIGGEAQGDGESLYFFSGCVYVKMTSHSGTDVKAVLPAIAGGLSSRIDPRAGYPAIVKVFPSEGRRAFSETYTTSGYIGHEFLKSVYTATYEADGKTFQLFIIDAKSSQGSKETLTAYLTFSGQSPDLAGEGGITVKDRYNGDIPLLWKGSYIVGIYSEAGDTIANAATLLKEVSEKL